MVTVDPYAYTRGRHGRAYGSGGEHTDAHGLGWPRQGESRERGFEHQECPRGYDYSPLRVEKVVVCQPHSDSFPIPSPNWQRPLHNRSNTGLRHENKSDDKRSDACHNCGERGHFIRACRELKKSNQKGQNGPAFKHKSGAYAYSTRQPHNERERRVRQNNGDKCHDAQRHQFGLDEETVPKTAYQSGNGRCQSY